MHWLLLAVVGCALVYCMGAETWTLKTDHVQCLNSFHNRHPWCYQLPAMEERLTTSRFGMEMAVLDMIMDRRLQWLGHVGHMEDG